MLLLGSDEFKQIVMQSAALRGKGSFEEAIQLVESKLPQMDVECLTNAYLEIIYAANEGGFEGKLQEYVQKLAKIDPDIPAVKKFTK